MNGFADRAIDDKNQLSEFVKDNRTDLSRKDMTKPRSGLCSLKTPSFEGVKSVNAAASDLLVSTFGTNAASIYGTWGTYKQAVFLNTIGAVTAQGVDLKKARFKDFYYGDSPDRAPFGVVVTGVSTKDLDRAGLGSSILYGRRSPREIKQGSIEASVSGEMVAFDIDLWNAKSEFGKHQEEIGYNSKNKTTTHPADVVRALNARGVFTGVQCR